MLLQFWWPTILKEPRLQSGKLLGNSTLMVPYVLMLQTSSHNVIVECKRDIAIFLHVMKSNHDGYTITSLRTLEFYLFDQLVPNTYLYGHSY